MRCESFSGDLVESTCDCIVVGLDDAWRESSEISRINVAMNGRVFAWDQVRKNKTDGVFEPTPAGGA